MHACVLACMRACACVHACVIPALTRSSEALALWLLERREDTAGSGVGGSQFYSTIHAVNKLDDQRRYDYRLHTSFLQCDGILNIVNCKCLKTVGHIGRSQDRQCIITTCMLSAPSGTLQVPFRADLQDGRGVEGSDLGSTLGNDVPVLALGSHNGGYEQSDALGIGEAEFTYVGGIKV